MKISGFTMGKNASLLYYPMAESIASILPIVDEFIVALGKGDPEDNTFEQILALNDPKIKIIHTDWDIEAFPQGTVHAQQTDVAKEACSGDWLFYLQADEVVHEQDHPVIEQACKKYLESSDVEGFLFNYYHFYGDYWHINVHHGWYPHEIRIIRNDPDIHSFISAQSFRRIPNFDGKSYRKKAGTEKLDVVPIDAWIYHYGWVRPPRYMQKKSRYFEAHHIGKKEAEELFDKRQPVFDYGNMHNMKRFKGSHPATMQQKIEQFDWSDKLNYMPGYKPKREKTKHERWRNRLLTWIEQNFLGGKQLFGYSNWNIIDPDHD